MTSSGGGDSGYYPGMFGNATPQPGLPIAGQDGGVNPREYGMFQNFLPEPVEEGSNPMATGLRPDMLKFRSPNGLVAESSGGGSSSEIEKLRSELAALTQAQGSGGDSGMQWVPGSRGSGSATDGPQPSEQGSWQPISGGGGSGGGGGGGIGTMGLGGGTGYQGPTVFGAGDRGGPAWNGIAPPANATQLPAPQGGWVNGNLPHWPANGPGAPQVAPGVNTDPAAAAAALAALKASGG